MTSQGYVFTINNPTEDDWAATQRLANLNSTLCLRAQLERGDDGTMHIQGAVEFRLSCRSTAVSRELARAHVEVRGGTPQQAWDYCVKDPNLPIGTERRSVESGTRPRGQGTRTDIEELVHHARTNGSIRDAIDHYPAAYFRYYRNYAHVREVVRPPRNVDDGVQVVLYWGAPGTGKTRKAYEENPGAYMVPLMQGGTVWYDGYNGEEVIIMDEFEGGMPLTSLLRLLDRYPIKVPVKGGFTEYTPKKIILTSNRNYDEWYNWIGREVKQAALRRRFTEILHFPGAMAPRMLAD